MKFVNFIDINNGEVFMYDNKYSMKVTNAFGVAQVVNLENGTISDLDPGVEVILLEGMYISDLWS